jgi:hypothetical protein
MPRDHDEQVVGEQRDDSAASCPPSPTTKYFPRVLNELDGRFIDTILKWLPMRWSTVSLTDEETRSPQLTHTH